MKTPDKIMRSIPRSRGNIPVPAIRKVPRGILKERRTIAAPKRKITIPTIISSLFTGFPPRFQMQIADFRFSLVPTQEHGNEIKQKMIVLINLFQRSDSEAIKPNPAKK